MKIYLAGLVQTGFVWRGNSASENVLLTETIRNAYPYDLESYHYLRDTRHAPEFFREKKKKIFLDSGAFSMFTQGIKVDLREYAEYIKTNADWIEVASNLDEIGAGKEEQTYANQKTLERYGVKVQPVHHARDADHYLQRYLDEGYDYIFLGGMVPESTEYLRGWLDRMWDRYLCHPDGSPRVKVHGFGLTTAELMFRYPWYSVDSTSWVMTGRFGAVYLDLPHRDVKVVFSDQSPKHRDLAGAHYDTLDPLTKEAVDARVKELGYDPALLRTHYGWRDHFNIAYFQRVHSRACTRLDRSLLMSGLFDA